MRGAAGEFPLDEKTIFTVGESLAKQFAEKLNRAPFFIIGRDTRESGAWIESAFRAGAENAGAACTLAGVITTPGVAFLAARANADAGVVISASHNPFQDNGIKIFAASGRKIDEKTERQIEADIAGGSRSAENYILKVAQPTPETAEIAGEVEAAGLQSVYIDYLLDEFVDLRLDNLKIVVDCANGAAFDLAPRLFRRFGAQVVAIFNQPNGRNINHECGSLHLEKLREKVVAETADFGVAFDGDADRALFVDESGEIVDGDATLWAMAQDLHGRGKLKNDTVVATVMSNLGLEIALKSRNINLVRTPVGDKYVLEELLKTETSLGGEQSGHIIFPERSLVGDGMRTALALLTATQHKSLKLSDLIEGFERFPQILVNIPVREKPDFEQILGVSEAVVEVEREMNGRGRLLLRYSGTELLARVMIEGERQNVIAEQAERIAAVIKREIGK